MHNNMELTPRKITHNSTKIIFFLGHRMSINIIIKNHSEEV